MSVTDKRETWQDAYVRAFRVIFIAVAPISILSIVFGADLLRFWIDDSMSQNGGPVLSVLAIAMMINAPAYVCVTVGQSLGRPALVAAAPRDLVNAIHKLVLLLSAEAIIRMQAVREAVSLAGSGDAVHCAWAPGPGDRWRDRPLLSVP